MPDKIILEIWSTNISKGNQTLIKKFDQHTTEYFISSLHKFFKLSFNNTKFKRGPYVRVHQ